jgi:hypothetical protein
MHHNNSASVHEEVKNASVQLANVAKFKQTVAKRLGQWWAVILSVAQLSQPCQYRRKIVGITLPELLQKFLYGA